MTTITEARNLVYQKFLDCWTGTPLSQVTLENESNRLDNGTDPFVRFTLRHTTGGQETLGRVGNRRFERQAIAATQIFTPAASSGSSGGMFTGDELAQEALDILEAMTFDGIYTNDGVIREQDSDGKWKGHLVTVALFYEERK